jgi:hypothetical protein
MEIALRNSVREGRRECVQVWADNPVRSEHSDEQKRVSRCSLNIHDCSLENFNFRASDARLILSGVLNPALLGFRGSGSGEKQAKNHHHWLVWLYNYMAELLREAFLLFTHSAILDIWKSHVATFPLRTRKLSAEHKKFLFKYLISQMCAHE